jgi:predicted nucleotidyltransferase component of viral defense system
LERVSLSSYRENFILKGGMLVASIVGVDFRATMDIDTTVKALPLNEADVQRVIKEICSIQLEDNVSFQIKSTRKIMEEFDYSGIRVMLEATLDRMRQPIKIDISTDDVITPKAVEYNYKLMFEDRTISVMTYNIETLLAEKMQTIINRGIANTRLRDFYDVYSIMYIYEEQIEAQVLYKAFAATCKKRKTVFSADGIEETLNMISDDLHMAELWTQFQKSNFFVGDLEWDNVIDYVKKIMKKYLF